MEIHHVTKEFIFEHLTEEDIFMRYFPLSHIKEGERHCNPLREDFNPDCKFYRNERSNILYFNDFAWRSFDCISFVQNMYQLSYYQTLEHIAKTFNLTSSEVLTIHKKTIAIKPKKVLDLKIAEKEFTHAELKFWKQYDDTVTPEILKEYHIHSLRSAWLDGKQIYDYSNYDLAFYYHLTNGYNYQLYNPNKFFNTTKFIQTKNTYKIGYHTQNKKANYVLIIKSYKCYFVSRRLGINSIGQLTETMLFDKAFMKELQANYEHIFTLFDNDKTGKMASINYKNRYNTIPLLFPPHMEKDLSDNVKENKVDVFFLMQELVETYDLTNSKEEECPFL